MHLIVLYIVSITDANCYLNSTFTFAESDILTTYSTCVNDSGQYLDGWWKEYYAGTSNIRTQGLYRNNEKFGTWIWKFEGGGINTIGEYSDDIQHGNWLLVNNIGSIIMSGKMCNGSNCGRWIGYHNNGVIKFDINWLNGKLCGKYINYNDSGHKSILGFMQSGAPIGRWMFVDINGNVTVKKHGGIYNDSKCKGKLP